MPDSFSLLTLNCFGALMPTTTHRLLALAHELERRSTHLACLQEVQLYRYQKLLVQGCASYPFHAYAPFIHCPKGGLFTLSRKPISKQSFVTYTEQGRWYAPTLMDKLLHKGMLITTLQWAETPVVIINTHLIANYSADWERQGFFAQMEAKQLHQLAETIHVQPINALVVVAGDFNIPRGSKLYCDFLKTTGLHDPLAGDTRPTYRPPPGVPTRYSLPIDFMLVRAPKTIPLRIDCDLCFSEQRWLDSKHQDYLSDHNGVEICFTAN